MRSLIVPIALAFGLIAAPVSAQTSARDFTLPEGPAQPESRPQGPVDDTGIIPVGPRVIRTEPEQPTTTPTIREGQPATLQNQPQVQPATTPAPSSAPPRTATPAPRPIADTSPSGPSEGAAIPNAQDEAPEQSDTTPATIQPDTPIISGMPEVGDVTDGTSFFSAPLPQWVLWLAGLLGLLVIALGLLAIRRGLARRTPSEIERPVISVSPAAMANIETPRFIARLDVQGFTRSMMMVTVQYTFSIANRSDIAMRDVRICADLVSVRRQLPVEQQVATDATSLPQVAEIERIGPQQARSITGTLQLPVDSIEPFFQGKIPLFVPLARLRVECSGAEPHLQTYVVGMGSAVSVGKVSPIPLNTPPGNVQGVMARALD